MFCLVLAFVLLLLNKLSRSDYKGEVQARVTYVNYPKGKIPVSPLPEELKLRVETTGFKLLWARVVNKPKVRIDLSQLSGADRTPTNVFKPYISSQLSDGYLLEGITPDTLYFQFENSLTKKVPVQGNIQISFKRQFDFKEPTIIKPDSVTVTGPEKLVDSIKAWYTEKLTFQNLDVSLQNEVALVKPEQPTIKISPEKVNYVVTVEEYTEKILEVEIQKVNLPDAKDVNIYPKKVKVACRVGLSNYQQVTPESFILVTDFATVDLKKSKYARVELKQAPSYVKSLDYSPKSVEYIIYK